MELKYRDTNILYTYKHRYMYISKLHKLVTSLLTLKMHDLHSLFSIDPNIQHVHISKNLCIDRGQSLHSDDNLIQGIFDKLLIESHLLPYFINGI